MLFTSKVRAEFPSISDDTLITPGMVTAAQNRELVGFVPGRFGCDIARWGDDETVIMRNRDGVIRCHKVIPKGDTMETAGVIADTLLDLRLEASAVVDVIGVGAGVFDRLSEQRFPVSEFNSSREPGDKRRFKNLRAEMWWTVRELFEDGCIDLDPDDDETAAELLSIKYKIDSAGRLQIEDKDETKKRLGRSPDRADAVMMSCYQGGEWTFSKKDRRQRKSAGLTDDLLTRAM
jgi:phage terminase large subunit